MAIRDNNNSIIYAFLSRGVEKDTVSNCGIGACEVIYGLVLYVGMVREAGGLQRRMME